MMKTVSFLMVFCLCSLRYIGAELPEYVFRAEERCLLREGDRWYVAKFQGYVQVTDVGIAHGEDRRPVLNPSPTLRFAGSRSFRDNTLMVLLDVFHQSFETAEKAMAWKGGNDGDENGWTNLVLRDPKALHHIMNGEPETNPKKK